MAEPDLGGGCFGCLRWAVHRLGRVLQRVGVRLQVAADPSMTLRAALEEARSSDNPTLLGDVIRKYSYVHLEEISLFNPFFGLSFAGDSR